MADPLGTLLETLMEIGKMFVAHWTEVVSVTLADTDLTLLEEHMERRTVILDMSCGSMIDHCRRIPL